MARRVVRKKQQDLTMVGTWVHEWKQTSDKVREFTARKNELRDRLKEVVEKFGETDDSGHIWFDLPEAVDGITKLKSERYVRQSFDYEAALALVQEKGLDNCVQMVPQLDEEAFMVAVSEGTITGEEYDALVEVKADYRFKAK